MMGVMLVIVGGLLTLAGKWPTEGGSGGPLGWIGRLPGDIFIKRDNFSLYLPLGTSILISVVGSLLLYFFMKH